MNIPLNVSIATIENELPGIKSYAERHGWNLIWNADELKMIFTGCHPKEKSPLHIIANVDGYRALPPIWTFLDPSGTCNSSSFFPIAGPVAGKGSIFHSSNRICAPFNRLAYKEHSGPHSNWGGPANWLNASNASHVQATKIANMFTIIIGHLEASKGMRR